LTSDHVFAQRGLADEHVREGRGAVEVGVGEQPELVETLGGQAMDLVEDEDLDLVGVGEVVEDGLRGLGRGALALMGAHISLPTTAERGQCPDIPSVVRAPYPPKSMGKFSGRRPKPYGAKRRWSVTTRASGGRKSMALSIMQRTSWRARRAPRQKWGP